MVDRRLGLRLSRSYTSHPPRSSSMARRAPCTASAGRRWSRSYTFHHPRSSSTARQVSDTAPDPRSSSTAGQVSCTAPPSHVAGPPSKADRRLGHHSSRPYTPPLSMAGHVSDPSLLSMEGYGSYGIEPYYDPQGHSHSSHENSQVYSASADSYIWKIWGSIRSSTSKAWKSISKSGKKKRFYAFFTK
ncbi:hypothetical protein CDL12_12949 [Handroanthus impetiginosus]|uniref:Uncharacterized protein n=1 Tax=Handroanthus impetiginosus TaxID=429701 RepID=A0A2G9HA81_9LAMI|nr:hypothetical protein CDL12_12949 [Handroanthus impetiginosus]